MERPAAQYPWLSTPKVGVRGEGFWEEIVLDLVNSRSIANNVIYFRDGGCGSFTFPSSIQIVVH